MENLLPDSPLSAQLQESAGYVDALRIIIAALIKTHPDKAALIAVIREIQARPSSQAMSHVLARQEGFDRAMAEMMSWAD
ncbi:hypothetical protein [Arenimonas aestuarii]